MVACKSWPPISAFKSSLSSYKLDQSELSEVKTHFSSDEEFFTFFGVQNLEEFYVSPKLYFDAKVDFEFKIFSKEWKSFIDYLIEYNQNDVKILYEAFGNYCSSFLSTFDCQVLTKMSLPGLAEGK